MRKRKPAGSKSGAFKGKDGKHRPDEGEPFRGGKPAGAGAFGAGERGETPFPPLEGQKSARLLLIKARHEAMKREIDQIREDLEAEEED
jgi:hypothetical protein